MGGVVVGFFSPPPSLPAGGGGGLVLFLQLKKKKEEKYAFVLVFLVAAFLTPPDLVSQIGLAIPTLILYEISILIVSMIEKKNNND
jgi:Sec-independent protein secretion pathway component TatC